MTQLPPPLPCPQTTTSRISGGVIAIGIISICLASMGLIGIPMSLVFENLQERLLSQSSSVNSPYSTYNSNRVADQKILLATGKTPLAKTLLVVAWMLEVVLLISGIGTLKLRPWARTTAIVYAYVEIVLVLIDTVMVIQQLLVTVPKLHDKAMATSAYFGTCLGSIVGLAYPIVLLWFYNRASVKAQFLAAPAPVANINNWPPPPLPPSMPQ